MQRLLYITHRIALAAFLLLLLALAPAMAQIVVYQGDITPLAVEDNPGDEYKWELYNDSTVDFAQVPGACPISDADFYGGNNGSAVQVAWKEPGVYFFKVTARNASGCTNNLKIGKVKVLPSLPVAVVKIIPDEICEGEGAQLQITFTGGKGPWDMKLQINDLVNGLIKVEDHAIAAWNNPYPINVSPKVTVEYTVIKVSNAYGVQTIPSNSVTLTVHPLPQKSPIYLKKP